jgi:hypothetical protein
LTRSNPDSPDVTSSTPRSLRSRPLRLALRLLLLALATATASACDEKLSDIAGPTPGLEPTFSSLQREIITPICSVCHTNAGRVPAGGLILLPDVAYANLVNVPSRAKSGAILVIPGDPDGSYLVQKLTGAAGIVGGRMPRTGAPLTEGQILIIKRWIQLGARSD